MNGAAWSQDASPVFSLESESLSELEAELEFVALPSETSRPQNSGARPPAPCRHFAVAGQRGTQMGFEVALRDEVSAADQGACELP